MNRAINNISFAILDVETTGFNPSEGERIIEIGILRIKAGVEEDVFQTLINPGRFIPEKISEITGINDSMVKTAPVFSDVADKILQVVEGAVIVCHNAVFDLKFLSNHFDVLNLPELTNPVLDTLMLARRHFNFPGNALGKIAEYLNLEHKNSHRAMGDVHVTRQILEYFIEDLKVRKNIETIEDLIELK